MNILFVSPLYRSSCADDLKDSLLFIGMSYIAVMMFTAIVSVVKGYPFPIRFAIAFPAILCGILGVPIFARAYSPDTAGVSYDAYAIHVRQCRALQLELLSYPRDAVSISSRFVHESRQRPNEPYLVFRKRDTSEEVASIPLRNSGANLPLLKAFAPGPLAQVGIR